MVKFDELKIQYNHLHCKLSIEDYPEFEEVTLGYAVIYDVYGHQISNHIALGDVKQAQFDYEENAVNVYINIKKYPEYKNKPFSWLDGIFFVHVYTMGIPAYTENCTCKTVPPFIAPVYDSDLVYSKMLSYVKELELDCSNSRGFVDWFLKYKAMDLAICTGDTNLAKRYWEDYIKGYKITPKCGCHGK